MKLLPLPARTRGNVIIARIDTNSLGFTPTRVWNPSPSSHHRTRPYPLPKTIRTGTRVTEESGAKFSPAPFAVVVRGAGRQTLIAVQADSGWHRWSFVDFHVDETGAEVRIDLEGHTPASKAVKHVRVFALPGKKGEESMALVARGLAALYPAASTRRKKIPSWWHRPIYCGWGDQVAISLDVEGPGPECRAMAYCTQGLYQRWVDRLEMAGVPVGTVTIDNGWSPGGVWTPYPNHWPDLRGFIDRQHRKGRRVLLWLGTFLTEDLPDEWCIFSGRKKVIADPTNPKYRAFVRNQVRRLLSPEVGGYNADGFKIDQLAFSPTETETWISEQFGRSWPLPNPHPKLKLAGTTWGCEVLYLLQKEIYDAAKSVKPDALITSSTVHPYFYDSFDMVRLHDTETVNVDVFEAMRARANLARAALPGFPIDADDWVWKDYRKWLDYTARNAQLGTACLFYAERFVRRFDKNPTVIPIPLRDLCKIARAWSGT